MASKEQEQKGMDRSDWQLILLWNVWFWASIVLMGLAAMRGG